jgi:hypothetical protein
MAVAIHMSDGQEVVVKGTLGEVQMTLLGESPGLGASGDLVAFDLDLQDGRVLVNRQHVTTVSNAVPGTVALYE